MNKPTYKKKRFWGIVIAIAAGAAKMFLKSQFPEAAEAIEAIQIPVSDALTLDPLTAGAASGVGLAVYGVIDARRRKNKTNRPLN